jgi:glucoamylase
VFDMPPQPFERYVKNPAPVAPVVWRMTSDVLKLSYGRKLRLEFLETTIVRWSADNWTTIQNADAINTGVGTYICDLPTDKFPIGSFVSFAVYWPKQNKWAGKNYRVDVSNGNQTAT